MVIRDTRKSRQIIAKTRQTFVKIAKITTISRQDKASNHGAKDHYTLYSLNI